jgi:hypothetical protein
MINTLFFFIRDLSMACHLLVSPQQTGNLDIFVYNSMHYLHLAEKVFYNCILRDQPEVKKTLMAFKSHTKLQYCKQH